MPDINLLYEAERSLNRIRPKILKRIREKSDSAFTSLQRIETMDARLDEHWARLFGLLHKLYGHHYDFFYYLEKIILTAIKSWLNRSEELHQLDLRRENDPEWYLSERMVGMSLYVDLFSGDLNHLRDKIPYLHDLGITYLHLMPLFTSRPGNSDGGYAVSDYRSVDPKIGRMKELRELAADLRRTGISLVLDFVFNHTSDDHEWAIRAQEGEREFVDYYHIYPDRRVPNQYEKNLREIFPTVRRGNFTWHEGMKRWVWTTFNGFQWDLKYANPEVFRAMAGEMLFLANSGVEVLRLDAVAFIWKEMGTNCENLPQAHTLIQAFNALCRIAAPSLVFKSEAIVHPDEVIRYIGQDQCQISYNPTVMALLWESLATRKTRLLRQSIGHRQNLPKGTAWVHYLRSHDDIGWSFDDGDARQVGINPGDHRDFLNRFYTGRFDGSFAAGVPFQHNEDTGDMRVSGTMASLAGLEQALETQHPLLLNMALKRIRMVYGILASMGGLPLLFMGEEWGMLNDYAYVDDPNKEDDSRWVHRPRMDWSVLDQLNNKGTPRSRIFRDLQQIIQIRKACLAFRGNNMRLLPVGSDHILAFIREFESNLMIVIGNFSEKEMTYNLIDVKFPLGQFVRDVFSDKIYPVREPINVASYGLLWLQPD